MAILLALGTTIWLLACSKPDPVASNATAVNFPAAAAKPTLDPQGGPPENQAEQTAPTTASKAAIPLSLQGRWGLTPADCTSTRGDAKGLLTVTAEGLNFYESRAVPAGGTTADDDSITGNFDFTGEGQNWTKFETLELNRDTLVRTESNPAASYTYAKC
jgi:hypothetical protein